MYSTISDTLSTTNYRDKIVSTVKNYVNKVKILDTNTVDNKIKIEISYVKDNGILIKQLFIHSKNVKNTLSKLDDKGFIIEDLSNVKYINVFNIDNNDNITNKCPASLNNLSRMGFNNSFYQKYK